jgi:hypothetical protein
MLILNKKIIARVMTVPLLSALLLSGCVQRHQFSMVDSYQQVKQTQILDPGAPERNEGIVLPLEGNYGSAVTQAYRKSNSQPREARGKITVSSVGN